MGTRGDRKWDLAGNSTKPKHDYEELKDGLTNKNPELLAKIETAYGYDGLGILTVRGIPTLEEKRMAMLPLANSFAKLPNEVKKKTETPHAFYQVGWSYGNEKLQGNKPDYAKGSYYCNPLVDVPSTDAELIKKFPSFLEPNIWPTEDLPGFEPAFKDLGRLVVDVGRMIAKQCDDYVEEKLGDSKGKFFKLLKESKCCKGRLLHYFPADEVAAMTGASSSSSDNDFSDWCGWHNDHGSLTGLVPAIYTNSDDEVVSCPDPEAGLYIRSRKGDLVKVVLPKGEAGRNCISFQIGETSQIHTGGTLQATPHAVRGAMGEASKGISRQTFAVFMEPEFDGDMDVPEGVGVEQVQDSEAAKHLPSSVRTLASRWQKGQDFGQFSDATFSAFY
ncbi:hypothetical protein TrRE_jg6139 [Triparma retinervis]|uniref:Non-haem dioxygenase N-terminal domain-containing protein n=1 Tax=Triparma retinervis TaxID=2557542 RepID=A0A9W6ZF55_9STRA|nr:hypothetical protein TrRE_jg6139 [Triparma retinervis]